MIHFFKGLNDRFSEISNHAMALLPSINFFFFFSLVVQQERQVGFGDNVRVFVNTKLPSFEGNT